MMHHFISTHISGIRLAFLFCLLFVVSFSVACVLAPVKMSDFQELTGWEERSEYLQKLSAYPSRNVSVQYKILGKTVKQRPIEALLIEPRKKEIQNRSKKLRIMLLAAQHGNEISGCEALMAMAGEWVRGDKLPGWMQAMELLVIPAVNPDGIENKKRVNARGVNISTDYGRLASPEGSAINEALLKFKPHVVLDIHESAVLKKKSLGAEGWLTDFEAQFEYANNPNIDEGLRLFCAGAMMPDILKAVQKRGLRADRYIGEITSTTQKITHGGLSVHNLRNKAGLLGAASFLVENRLDPSTGTYPTPRNIKERARKQMLCIDVFLSVCQKYSKRLMALSEKASKVCRRRQTVWLQPVYIQNPKSPMITIPLRRIDTSERVTHRFVYRKDISTGPAANVPEEYRFFSHLDFFADWLSKQGIPSASYSFKFKQDCITVHMPGENSCLLPIYLEANSTSSILKRISFDANPVRIQKK